METLIEAIRTALLPGATDETKREGAVACRTILTALDAKEGEPMSSAMPAPSPETPVPQATTASPIPMPDLSAIVRAVAAMGPDQLLEVAIAKLRASVPDGATVRSLEPVRFSIVPIPPVRR